MNNYQMNDMSTRRGSDTMFTQVTGTTMAGKTEFYSQSPSPTVTANNLATLT